MDFKDDRETKESRVCKASQVSKVNVDEMVVMDADEVVMIVECADYQVTLSRFRFKKYFLPRFRGGRE